MVDNQMRFSRRALLKASAASAVLGGGGAPFVARAQTAEFTYKYANNLPDAHPMNVRAKEMAAAIKSETNGRVDLQIFPNNQLGSDTDMLSQIRSGGVEFFTLSGLILATLVPAASISGIGFAFPDYDTVWKAMDGGLRAYVRGEITKAGLMVMDNICAWEKLPEDIRTVVAKNINAAGVKEREDVAKLNAGLQQDLAAKGLVFNQPNVAPFREKLRSAGFYAEWKGKYGDQAWELLEKSVGKLSNRVLSAGGRHGSCRTEREQDAAGSSAPAPPLAFSGSSTDALRTGGESARRS